MLSPFERWWLRGILLLMMNMWYLLLSPPWILNYSITACYRCNKYKSKYLRKLKQILMGGGRGYLWLWCFPSSSYKKNKKPSPACLIGNLRLSALASCFRQLKIKPISHWKWRWQGLFLCQIIAKYNKK